VSYLVTDAIRFADLCRMDTCCESVDDAKTSAEAMAKKYGGKVFILAVVGEVEGLLTQTWNKDPSQRVMPWGLMG
jgi:hypothetical protein